MQERAEKSTATLCPFLCPTNEEDLLRHCLQIFSLLPLAHGQVQSGYLQPTHQAEHTDATDSYNKVSMSCNH